MPPNTHTEAHQATAWDRAAVTLLGTAGCTLSYDALQQIAVAIHIRPALSYLFPLVIDGFIAYGVRALLVLRDAPWLARAYAWTLFGAATAASLWANALHAMRLNRPGVHTLTLGGHTVAVLSAIAPLALAGATHMHILIGRHTSGRATAAGTPHAIPAVPTMIPAEQHEKPAPPQQAANQTDPAAETTDTSAPEAATTIAVGVPGRDSDTTPDRPPQSGRSGRKAEATIGQLAEIIGQTYPGATQVTRAMARQAVEARGISAGNERIAEALRTLRPSDDARPHPSTD